MFKLLKFSTLAILCITLSACAGGARYDRMAITPTPEFKISKSNKYYDAITITKVTGGKETNPMLASKVDNNAFMLALEDSLKSHGLLDTNGNAKYILSSEILALEQPMVGFSFTVDSVVNYTVKNASTNSVVFDKTVKQSGKATMGDSALGVERLRMANEFSIQNNIRSFIDQLLTK